MTKFLIGLSFLFCLMFVSISPAYAQDTDYSIETVAEDLYRFSAGPYRSMFWVTGEGIVIIDPLNTEAAKWLSAELAKRYDVPIKYVIYSHDHYDHSYGGEVFDQPGVTFLSHEFARDSLVRSKAQTHFPEQTFEDEYALTLDGETLRLRYHGPNNGAGSVSFHFEKKDVLFVVDWIVAGRLPWKSFEGYDIDGMIRSTKDVLELDWDTFVGGHADIGGREEVIHYLDYLETLYASVLDGMIAGKSLETLKDEIRLTEFSDLKMFEEWRELNISGVYNQLKDKNYLLKRPELADGSEG